MTATDTRYWYNTYSLCHAINAGDRRQDSVHLERSTLLNSIGSGFFFGGTPLTLPPCLVAQRKFEDVEQIYGGLHQKSWTMLMPILALLSDDRSMVEDPDFSFRCFRSAFWG